MKVTVQAAENTKIQEQRVILSGISWKQYESLTEILAEFPCLRITYLDGRLEIMTPSPEHENSKATIGELLSAYLIEKKIRFYRCGSPTLKNQDKAKGKKPDESYNIGIKKDLPDIAIEIIVSSGGLDSLAVYESLGIPEVWFYQKNNLSMI